MVGIGVGVAAVSVAKAKQFCTEMISRGTSLSVPESAKALLR
jgi:hypothetical protein